MNTPVVKILVCCHKPGEWLSDDVYIPIQCGKAISKYDLGIQGDDTGDNISAKNPYYCELTALYWAWKNLKNVNYIGLCHYRRYFDFEDKILLGRAYKNVADLQINQSLNLDVVFKKYDVILPKRDILPDSLECHYKKMHIAEDWEMLKQVIQEKYPEYVDGFIQVTQHNNKMAPYNMFIMPYGLFCEYCQWLFSLLSEMEQRIQISPNVYQQRIFGFMAERLLNVWTYNEKLKIKYMPILKIDHSEDAHIWKIWGERIAFAILAKLRECRHETIA